MQKKLQNINKAETNAREGETGGEEEAFVTVGRTAAY